MDTVLENNAFAMFRNPCTEDYKRHLLLTVKAQIDSSPRITVKKLKALMQTKFFATPEDVDGALAALLNVFGCISSFTIRDRQVTHLNPKQSTAWDNYSRCIQPQEQLA